MRSVLTTSRAIPMVSFMLQVLKLLKLGRLPIVFCRMHCCSGDGLTSDWYLYLFISRMALFENNGITIKCYSKFL